MTSSTSEPASSAWKILPTSSKLAGAIARVSPSYRRYAANRTIHPIELAAHSEASSQSGR